MTSKKFERVEIGMDELDAILVRARSAPISEADHQQLKAAISTLAFLTRELEKKRTSIAKLRQLLFGAKTEKTDAVLNRNQQHDTASDQADGQQQSDGATPDNTKKKRRGHGRNGASNYTGAARQRIPHELLQPGDSCPESDCRGKVYGLKQPGVIVRIKGMPPLAASVYELQKLRCALCDTVFTAEPPEGVGEAKYDETAVSLIAMLKYGSGFPFNRLEKLERNFGIPLPASTQWELVERAAQPLQPIFEHYIDEAAQGEVLHNDDTPMKILELMKENQANQTDKDKVGERRGMFTSGIISQRGEHLVALFFTGRQHAGENLNQVLAHRSEQLAAPIQMCDALSRNVPAEFETVLSNCLSHGRRQFVTIVENFPEQCRHLLETLADVYTFDTEAREQKMTPRARLRYHKQHSKPLMDDLHDWLNSQFDEKLVEPNSSLGQAISYMLNHWKALTLFLRKAGAPLDNNIVERALKKTILHRKNALFYKTKNGARVGDLYMTLIHTAELARINAFDYLCMLQRHAEHMRQQPCQWMPWNYQETVQRITTAATSANQP